MPSVDEASNMVGGNAEHARELFGAIVASKTAIDEIGGILGAMGFENKANVTAAIGGDAEALAGQANALADALDQLRGRIESLRALVAGFSSGGSTSASGPVLSARSTGAHHKSYDPVKAEPIQPFKDRHKTVGRSTCSANASGTSSGRVKKARPSTSMESRPSSRSSRPFVPTPRDMRRRACAYGRRSRRSCTSITVSAIESRTAVCKPSRRYFQPGPF